MQNARVGSLDRGLTLLQAIIESGSISVTEAAKLLGVVPSTAHRLLMTLVDRGYAHQGRNQRYEPGVTAMRISLASPASRLRDDFEPHLARLHERIGETVHLATLVGNNIQHVAGVESDHLLRITLRIGVPVPAHTTSAGKAMLAELPDSEIAWRYRLEKPRDRHGRPLPDGELDRLLKIARRDGYGSNQDESEPGMAAVAVAVGVVHSSACALSWAVPSPRFTPSDLPDILKALRATRDEVLRELPVLEFSAVNWQNRS